MTYPAACALIAEDEPLLARDLARTLTRLWPALRICAVVHDGDSAVEAAQLHRPDIVFMDIRMPERNGLDAAQSIVDDWPEGQPLPLTVFVTAFDRYAVDAFEQAATDYVLKPVVAERLALTCERLAGRLRERQGSDDAAALAPIKALLGVRTAEPPLTVIQAGVGSTVHMVPVADIHYFAADDKYVRVVTAERELLIRTPLRELSPRLDATQFLQVHRGTLVRTTLIDRVVREDTGRIHLFLKGRPEKLSVSRSYAHLFKPM
ncbi:MAG TPA: LytTR family DNA-binding domain-containing protein [Candidatus Aquabacterium excrementipullorum]|nr:LytTR family DNA-binding domain-containing protein [Candidatus Aquabacterium excrementipullorum]